MTMAIPVCSPHIYQQGLYPHLQSDTRLDLPYSAINLSGARMKTRRILGLRSTFAQNFAKCLCAECCEGV